MNQNNAHQLVKRLNQHPKLRARMEGLLNVVENAAGDCTKADDAEQYVIEELRKMGSDALHCWADNAVMKSTQELREKHKNLHGNGQKNSIGTAFTGK